MEYDKRSKINLKITKKSQIFALREIIIVSIIFVIVMYFWYLYTDFEALKIVFLTSFAVYFIVWLLPVMILHINHLNKSCTSIVIEQNQLTVNGLTYTAEEIEKIIVYATHQHFSGHNGVTSLPYNDYYYYVEINLKNSERINISSLIDYKIDKIIEEHFKSVKIIKQSSFFVMLII